MNPLPSRLGPDFPPACPDAVRPAPPKADRPPHPFDRTMDEALSAPDQAGPTEKQEEEAPREDTGDPGQCPPWACLLQVPPAPPPTLPAPAARSSPATPLPTAGDSVPIPIGPAVNTAPAASPPPTPAADPATFAPDPGKNVSPNPGTLPILTPAKDGMNGAQLAGVTMQQAENSAARTETGVFLPSSGTGTVPEVSSPAPAPSGTGLPPDQNEGSGAAGERFRQESPAVDAAPERPVTSVHHAVFLDPTASADRAADLREPAVAAPAPASPVERLALQMRERILEFRERRADALSVVLRPDTGTELHLQLRLRGDQVEVLAHCLRGDSSVLKSQWHQLQQSLASQGVRLAGLETGAGDPRRQPAPQPPPPAEPAGVPAPPSLRRPGERLPARPATVSRRLLESWA